MVTSKFYETAHKKMLRVEKDFTQNGSSDDFESVFHLGLLSVVGQCKDAFLRLDLKVWQDRAGGIDRENLRRYFIDAGAIEVDIRIVRVPRETVRAESVLKADRLRNKLAAMAKIRGEEVGESILLKADAMEDRAEEELLVEVAK